MTEDDIRAVLADEAAGAVPGSVVLDRLRAPRKRRTGVVALVAAGVIALVGAVVVPLALTREPAQPPAAPVQPPARVAKTVVVMGVDGQHADTVMLVRLDGGRVDAVSVPRDSWVELPGREPIKLNAVYLTEGPAALAEVVGELTGQEVDHWAAVDMAGFEALSTAVGGVEVCLRKAVSDEYSGAEFPAGRVVVEGGSALAFVRQRHGLPNGELDRIVRQQVFVRSLVGELVAGALDDPARRDELARLVRELVRTDPGWDPLSVAVEASRPARLATVPVREVDRYEPTAGSVVELDLAEVRAFTAEFFAPPVEGGPTKPPSPPGDGCVN